MKRYERAGYIISNKKSKKKKSKFKEFISCFGKKGSKWKDIKGWVNYIASSFITFHFLPFISKTGDKVFQEKEEKEK